MKLVTSSDLESSIVGRTVNASTHSRDSNEPNQSLTEMNSIQDQVGGRKIDFGCAVPFVTMPPLIRHGFQQQINQPKLASRVRVHYNLALQCLEGCIGDPRCDLLLMLTLTLCASSARPDVEEGEHLFSIARYKCGPAILAANLVTRILWFLKPEAFPWEEGDREVFRISEMTPKMGKSCYSRAIEKGVRR